MERYEIEQILSEVIDPQTGLSITSRKMIQNIDIKGNVIKISIAGNQLSSEVRTSLLESCTNTIIRQFPDADVNLHFIQQNSGIQVNEDTVPQIKNIIAVASGKGGVGKSSVSVNLALALKSLGAKVGLIDADLYGPSIPTMLGLQGQRPKMKDVHGTPKLLPLEAYGMPVMSIGFIVEPEQAVVLRGPRLAGIIKQFFNDVIWPELDYLIVDLPPGTGDIQLTLVQTVALTGAILVTTPQEVALVDAVKAMNMFMLPQINVPIIGVVENMSWFIPDDAPEKKYPIFGEGGGKKLALASSSVLLGQIPLMMEMRSGSDTGKPVVLNSGNMMSKIFEEIAKKTSHAIQMRHETLPDTEKVRVD